MVVVMFVVFVVFVYICLVDGGLVGCLLIGFVLFGGGVCGYVYFGVLKVLEDNWILIDCIVGISMGVVVGGLYVSGMVVDEM